MKRILLPLVALALCSLPAQAGISLEGGVLTLTAQDNVPGWFVVAPAYNGRVAVYHDSDGKGIQTTYYPVAAVQEVVFEGGAQSDMCWVQVEGLVCTFTGAGGQDSMLGSIDGDNEFFCDGLDFLAINVGDVVHGTPAGVYIYPK